MNQAIVGHPSQCVNWWFLKWNRCWGTQRNELTRAICENWVRIYGEPNVLESVRKSTFWIIIPKTKHSRPVWPIWNHVQSMFKVSINYGFPPRCNDTTAGVSNPVRVIEKFSHDTCSTISFLTYKNCRLLDLDDGCLSPTLRHFPSKLTGIYHRSFGLARPTACRVGCSFGVSAVQIFARTNIGATVEDMHRAHVENIQKLCILLTAWTITSSNWLRHSWTRPFQAQHTSQRSVQIELFFRLLLKDTVGWLHECE